jgi:hypothetical protein
LLLIRQKQIHQQSNKKIVSLSFLGQIATTIQKTRKKEEEERKEKTTTTQ